MTPADQARDNALHCEMVKYAYRQTKDGVVVSFVVHPNEVPAELSTSHIGTRYVVALVQLGDDELPIKQPKEVMPNIRTKSQLNNARPLSAPQVPAGAKRDWRDLQPAQQAGIRCEEPAFRVFLDECHSLAEWNGFTTAQAVRALCGVHSRVELGTNQKARVIWHQLDTEYQVWLAKERVGA